MTLHKNAQEINFKDPEFLIKQFSRMSDRDYNEHISVLNQVYNELDKEEAPLELIVQEIVASGMYEKKILNIIAAIGRGTFEFSRFDALSDALTALTREAQEEIPSGEMSLEDRVSRYKQQNYPVKTQEESNELKRLLANLDAFYHQSTDSSIPERNRRHAFEALEEIFAELDMFLEEGSFEYLENIEPEAEKVELPKEDEQGEAEETKATPVGMGVKLSDEEVSAIEDGKRGRNSYSTERPPEHAMSHPLFGENATESDFILVTDGEVSFATDKIEEMYNNTISFFDHVSTEVENRIAANNFNVPLDLAKEFNDFMFSLKIGEYQIIKSLLGLRQNGTIDDDEHRELYSELISILPCGRIRYDSSLFEFKLFEPLVYMSNPWLSKQLFSDLMKIESSQLMNYDQKTLKDAGKDVAKRLLKNKWATLLDSSGQAYYTNVENFIKTSYIRPAYIISHVGLELNGKPAYMRITKCPTCSKDITWNYTKEFRGSLVEDHGVIKGKKQRSFRIQMYSIFRRPKTGSGTEIISIEELMHNDDGSVRLFEPPDASGYDKELERQTVSSYKGKKSWAQINDLIYSDNRDLHEEGWHRRMAALKSLGGIKIADHTYIRNMMSECPYSKEGSYCGLSYKSTGVNTFNLQPTQHSGERWRGTNIENLEDRKSAIKKTSGGYKFSRLIFKCPAHISDVDFQGVGVKYGRMAISKVGVTGSDMYIPPVDGRTGAPKQMEDGTMAYLVCGASTSISSFDRDPGSHGYIVGILKQVRMQNPKGYISVINYLLKNGIDVNDILKIESEIKSSTLSDEEEAATEVPVTKATSFLERENRI